MKVIAILLSVVCLSTARYVKWSPNDVNGHRDFKEDFHQFWSQLGDLLEQQDEQAVKEFLHQTFQVDLPIYEGIIEEEDVHHDLVKPNRPFKHHHIQRPSHHDEENMMRHHEDSVEQLDAEMSRPIPPKPQRPHRPGQTDDNKYIMRPLHDLPAEIDGEMIESPPQKPIMRPVLPEVEDMDNVMRPLPLKPLRPLRPNRPAHSDDDKYIMRPLIELPAEIDGEMVESLPQKDIERPVRPEVEDMDNVMRPLPLKSLRPLPNRPAPIDDDKNIMRPLVDLPVEIDGEMEESLPEKDIKRPVRPEVEVIDMVLRPDPLKPFRPLPNRPAPIDDDKNIMRPLVDLPVEIDIMELEESLAYNPVMRPLGPVEVEDV